MTSGRINGFMESRSPATLVIWLIILILPTTDTMPQSLLHNYSCDFRPSEIVGLFEGDVMTVFVNCSYHAIEHPSPQDQSFQTGDSSTEPVSAGSIVWLTVCTSDPFVTDVVGRRRLEFNLDEGSSNKSFFQVQGLFVGRTTLKINYVLRETNDTHFDTLVQQSSNTSTAVGDSNDHNPSCDLENFNHYQLFSVVSVSVLRKERVIDQAFVIVISVLVVIANFGMGCKIDLSVVKEVLVTRPMPVIIGLCNQYVIMPLMAFGFIKLFGLTGGLALGYFAAGCAPGGQNSNMYTFLLGGDVSLSVTMTLVSLVTALGMFPLWLYTLSQLVIAKEANIHIPFKNIVFSLLMILIPLAVGIFVQKKWQRGAQFILKCLKPFYLFFVIAVFAVTIGANLYIFYIVTPRLMLVSCLLPYCGFCLSSLIAFIARQPKARIVTIAIETGIQDLVTSTILLKISLPQPDADLSVVLVGFIAMWTPIPLWFAIAILEIKKCCLKRKDVVIPDNDIQEHKVSLKELDQEITYQPPASPSIFYDYSIF